MALITDTGPLYAAMDRNDQDHSACTELLIARREPLVVPAPVIIELDSLVGSRLGPMAMNTFLADVLDGTITVAELSRSDYARTRELCAQYADLPLGFVDAAVIAVLERFEEQKLATLDLRHFSIVRPRHTTHLQLLPELDR